MITLDEAIKHAEDVARENEEAANDYELQDYVLKNKFCKSQAEKCRKCAEEHRQLAAWLRDYKRLLAIAAGVDVRCGNCRFDGVKGLKCYSCYQYSNWEEAGPSA